MVGQGGQRTASDVVFQESLPSVHFETGSLIGLGQINLAGLPGQQGPIIDSSVNELDHRRDLKKRQTKQSGRVT